MLLIIVGARATFDSDWRRPANRGPAQQMRADVAPIEEALRPEPFSDEDERTAGRPPQA